MRIVFIDLSRAVTADALDTPFLQLDCKPRQHGTSMTLANLSNRSIRVEEVALLAVDLPEEAVNAPIYAEGYSMLSQYAGTLGAPACLTPYSDAGHYRMPQTHGRFTVYNLLLVEPEPGDWLLLAFASCRRFRGEFRLGGTHIEAVLACEGIALEAGETWELEELYVQRGSDREALLETLAQRIGTHHPRLPVAKTPAGWCSWYCYGPAVSEADVYENLDAIATSMPELQYVQIDDGYQARMGDWLEPGESFASDMPGLCQAIRQRGFEPAVWLAPFIAEEDSRLFRAHPEWFVTDGCGRPLRSDRVTFGGWNRGPWYMLDGTHPGACAHIKSVVSAMREQWGCHYFKLDATVWGAFPFGRRHDDRATSIEAYRLGMRAVLEGAGAEGFVLGCNAPLWGSLGSVHAMRVSGDIVRNWPVIHSVARECFHRNWQNGRLWVNDPDCVVLENQSDPFGDTGDAAFTGVTPDEFGFHAAAIAASGGMVLSGDRIPLLSARSQQVLKKLVCLCGNAARFDAGDFTVGRIDGAEGRTVCVFNWCDDRRDITIPLPHPGTLIDFFTGEQVGRQEKHFILRDMAPHSGRVFRIEGS